MDNQTRFDAAAASWDQNPTRAQLVQDLSAAIRQAVPLDKNMRMLDFGCGTGLITLALKPLVGAVLGLDTSRGMLDELEAKLTAGGIADVTTLCAELAEAGLDPDFDLIVSSMALHHVADTASLLREFYRLLKPGGYLAVADLDPDEGRFHPDPSGVHHNGFDRAALAARLEQTGFEAVVLRTAASLSKPVAGQMQNFPIFLASGRKPL